MSQVWNDQTISNQTDLIVLLAIADYANQDNIAWPSIKSLATKTRLTERGVYKILARLRGSKITVNNSLNGVESNQYRLLLPPEHGSPLPLNGIQVPPEHGSDDPSVIRQSVPPSPKIPQKNPAMLRLDKLFGRRIATRWDKKELAALKSIEPIAEDEFQAVEQYYSVRLPEQSDYRRRDLKTLLNNWNGEVDRARKFKPNTGY